MTDPVLAYDAAWNRPDPRAMYAAGYRIALRYLSRDPSKNIDGVGPTRPYHSTGELQAIRGAGLDLALVWETTADRAKAGYAAGSDDAGEANAQADAIGYPQSAVIFYAVDYDADPVEVEAYFRGVASRGGRPRGAYAGGAVLEYLTDKGLISYGWQTMSSGFRGSHNPDGSYRISPAAHLIQRVRPTRQVSGDYDEDAVLRSFPTMLTAQQPRPAPPPAPISWKEVSSVKTADVQVPTDGQGNGYLKVGTAKPLAAVVGVPSPETRGYPYPDIEVTCAQCTDGQYAVVVTHGPANGNVRVTVTTAA